jgi:hypothetical protein
VTAGADKGGNADKGAGGGDTRAGRPVFDERLRVPLWWHLGAVLAAGVFGSYPAAWTDHAATRVPVYAVTFAAVELLLLLSGRARVRVADGELRAAGAVLPLADVRATEPLPDVRRGLTPGVLAQTRPWVPTGVRVGTRDATWVLSTRRPALLVAALTAAEPPTGTTTGGTSTGGTSTGGTSTGGTSTGGA